MVEQRTENPRVPSSILGPATIDVSFLYRKDAEVAQG